MDMENKIERKQDYIRINILEKGFSPDEFADFLVLKRGEPDLNLTTLTMNELRQGVQEFIQAKKSRNINIKKDKKKSFNNNKEEEERKNNEKEEVIMESQKENKNKILEKEEKKLNEKEEENESLKSSKKEVKETPKKNKNISELYGIVIPNSFECKKLEKTPLSIIKNLVITVSLPEKKGGSFFGKSYTTYLITTIGINLKVRRRYSDFVWFRQLLVDLYPYIVIPPIPKKNKIGIDNFSDTFISKRMRYLEKFLNWLLTNQVVKNSKLFYDFLSIENDDELNKVKAEYQKKNTPINLIEFYHKNGKLNLFVNNEKEKYFKNISENSINNETLLNNLNIGLKQLRINFDLFIQKLEEVQQNWEALYANSTKYYEDIHISTIYDKMSKIFKNWSISLKNQNSLIYSDVRECFKYVRNVFKEVKNMINNTESVKSEYNKAEKALINKKEDLFKKGDVQKWELDPKEKTSSYVLVDNKVTALFKMCAKDTEKVIQRKIYYGFYLNQLIEEYERIRNYNRYVYEKNINNFCKKITGNMVEFHKHIVDNMIEDEDEKINDNIN